MSTMLDFDVIESALPSTPMPVEADTPTNRVGTDSVAHVMKPTDEWDWKDLRDYVMREMERYHGPQVRDSIKERSIFGSFIKRHGAVDAAAIAQYAFGFCEGMWSKAPISVNRFCRNSDQYFAEPIKQRLA
jgi:hypothetical protein